MIFVPDMETCKKSCGKMCQLRKLRKIMESGWKSDVKKARGLDWENKKVFGERERLRG